jgi:CheY-like chemotaxis protein/PAS domain-containing protein/HPt (histidine-containing phosphotransfer) domain-containing protein
MSNQWHGHLSRLKEQTAELKDQIADLKETLLLIGAAVEEQRLLLEERTRELRSSLEQSTDSGKAPNQLPSVLTILHNPDMGAILIGPDGRYLLFNPVAEEILGSSITRNMESSEFGFYLADQVTRCERDDLPWQRCAHGQGTHEEVLFVKRSDVTDGIWIRTLSMPIYNDDGESNGSVAFVLDTTEQMIVENQINEVLQTLQEQLTSIELAEQLLIKLAAKLSTTTLSATKEKAPETKVKSSEVVEESDFSPVPASEPGSLETIALKVQRLDTTKEIKESKQSKHSKETKTGSLLQDLESSVTSDSISANTTAKVDNDALAAADTKDSNKATSDNIGITAEEDTKTESPVTPKETWKKERSKGLAEHRIEKAASSSTAPNPLTFESSAGVDKDAVEEVSAVQPELVSSDLAQASEKSPDVEPVKAELEARKEEAAREVAAASNDVADTPTGSDAQAEVVSEPEAEGVSESKDQVEVIAAKEVTVVTPTQIEIVARLPVESEFKIETTLKSAIAAASEQAELAQNSAKETDAQVEAINEPNSVAATPAVVEIDVAPITSDHIATINRKNRKLTNTVLVVDDIPVNQKLLSLQLSRLGFDVEVASNGKEAVDAVVKKDFDIVFMDLDMPIMDGPKATAAIRNIEAVTLKYVPIVAMTSYKRDVDRQRCLTAGMDDYLTKGANRKQLLEVINNYVRPVVDAEDQVARLQSEHPPAEVEVTKDFDSLKSLHGQDEMQEVSRLFYSSVSTFVECLQLAIDERKADAVTHFAHCIKGPADSLGLTQLTNILAEMIDAAESEDWTHVVFHYMNLRSNYTQVIGRLKDLFGADHLTPVVQ